MEKAKEGVRIYIEKMIGDKGIVAAVDAAIRNLAKVGVSEAMILDKFSVASRTALGVDQLVILKGDLSALQSGRDYVELLYPPTANAGKAVAAKGTASVKERLMAKAPNRPPEAAGDDANAQTEPKMPEDTPPTPIAPESQPELSTLESDADNAAGLQWEDFVGEIIGLCVAHRQTFPSSDAAVAAIGKWVLGQGKKGKEKSILSGERKRLYVAAAGGRFSADGKIIEGAAT